MPPYPRSVAELKVSCAKVIHNWNGRQIVAARHPPFRLAVAAACRRGQTASSQLYGVLEAVIGSRTCGATVMNGKVLSLILSFLTPDERAHAVAYALNDPVPAGTTIASSPAPVVAPSNVYVAFVDQQPSANWGHPARYLLVDAQSGALTSVDARFPPFAGRSASAWHVIYRAPGIPDTFVATPN
jgi:hypothetical protein